MKDKVSSDSHHYTISPIWLLSLKGPGDNQGAVVVHPYNETKHLWMDSLQGGWKKWVLCCELWPTVWYLEGGELEWNTWGLVVEAMLFYVLLTWVMG